MRRGEGRPGPVDYLPAEQAAYRTMAPPPEQTVRPHRRKKQLPPKHYDDVAGPFVYQNPGREAPPPRHLSVPGDAPRPDPGPYPILRPVRTSELGRQGEYHGFPYPPGPDKQRKQRGKARDYDKRRYRKKRQQQKLRSNLWYKKMKAVPGVKKDRARRRKDPDRFKRLPGGGTTDPADRAKEWRQDHREGGAFFIVEKGEQQPNPEPRRRQRQFDPGDPTPQDFVPPELFEQGPWRAEPPLRAIRASETPLSRAAAAVSATLRLRSQGLLVVRSEVSSRGWTEFRVVGSSKVARRVRLEGGGPGRWARARCSCPFWVFGGPEYHAAKGGYLLGVPRGAATPPQVRDPSGVNLLCKHVLAALRWGKQKQGSLVVPTYQMQCRTCRAQESVQMGPSPRPTAPCSACSGTLEAVLGRVAMAQRGDDWVGRAQKLRGQMGRRADRIGRAEQEQRRELPRLQPNVGGLRTETWAEAARLAQSQGLDPEPFRKMDRKGGAR